MMCIAHRGYSGKFCDNTIESFLGAKQAGFDMIELDIQLCASGEIIVYHDTYIDNTFISSLSFDSLRSLDSTIPTLEDVFQSVHNIDLYLDVKGNDLSIVSAIKLLSIKYINVSFYIASYNQKILRLCRQLLPNVSLGLITENTLLTPLIFDVEFYVFHWTALDHSMIDSIHSLSRKVFTYTYKEPIDLTYMKLFNVDGIVSNHLIRC